MINNGNFISRFIDSAACHPEKIALQLPQMEGQEFLGEELISYRDLSNLVSSYKILWQKKGWKAGDRVIVILKPSKELYAIALALFSLGIVAVFIDTGMGRKKIQMAIRDSNAKAIISMQALIKLFWFVPALWPLKRFAIDGSGLGYQNINDQVEITSEPLSSISRSDIDHGLISFTSGSTGRPKGADRTHFSLLQQHFAIRDHWPDKADDIDCPCFPVMVLHNLCCGMTTVMPKVDLAEPSAVNAEVVIQQIRQHKITRLSGAPAYISGLVNFLKQQQPGFNRVLEVQSLVVGGATVSIELAKGIDQVFPNADARIVYGSTEAEPIADISIKDYLSEALAKKENPESGIEGYLVGHVVDQIDMLISNIDESKNENGIDEETLLSGQCERGEVGEILVSGDHVLKQYIDNPAANRENKIPRKNVPATKSVWHRTGDCGYLDQQGRLWLSGRIKDVIQVKGKALQPYPIEQVLDQDVDITRAAVLDHDNQVYVFIQIESKQSLNSLDLKQRTLICAVDFLLPAGITAIHYVEIDKMPVDGRHNSKIDRPKLRENLKNNVYKNIQLLPINLRG